jgi:hypothetical protein
MSDVLEWDVRVPLVSNVYVIVDILFLVLFLSAAMAGLILYLTGFQNVYAVLRLFILADAVLVVLLFMVMGFVFTNQFQLRYRLSDEGVHCVVGDFEGSINRAAWVISGLAQRFSFTGGRTLSMVNEKMFVSWSQVARAFFDDRRKVATLTSDLRPLMRVYCTPDNVGPVFAAIRGFVPEPVE